MDLESARQQAVRAQADGNQAALTTVIESEWPHLLRERGLVQSLIATLDADHQAQPSIRVIRAQVRPQYPVFETEVPDEVLQLEKRLARPELFTGDSHRVGLELAVMLALKDRSQYERARQHAWTIRWILADSVLLDEFDSKKLARATVHTGIVHMLVGDVLDADAEFNVVTQLPDAYPSDLASAASELAMLHALGGDHQIAQEWTRFVGTIEDAGWDEWVWAGPRIALITAELLRSVDMLDWPRYDRAVSQMVTGRYVADDHLYLSMYARARAALLRGEQRQMLTHLIHLRQNWPKPIPRPSLPQTLVDSIETDLALSIGDYKRAQAVIPNEITDYRHVLQRVRWNLATGRTSEAEVELQSTPWLQHASRRGRVDLQLALATALLRQGKEAESVNAAVTALAQVGDPQWLPYSVAIIDPRILQLAAGQHAGVRAIVDHLDQLITVRPTIDRGADTRPTLSQRELEVLRLVATGKTAKEIADRLLVSVHTVRNLTQRIYRKLDATSRRHALDIATTQGLLDKSESGS